jgi:nitrite reductase/ring-hydroxylating ferredoxin subunit
LNASDDGVSGPRLMAENMGGEDWHLLEGVSADAESFPQKGAIGGESILVFRTPKGLRGVQTLCPHLQYPMTRAQLVAGGNMLRCAVHGWTFRLADGKGVNCPGNKIKVYAIKQDGPGVYAREDIVEPVDAQ